MLNNQIYKKIRDRAKEKGISIKDLCRKIEMSEGGFYTTEKNNSLKIDTLLKIAEVLGVTHTYFFSESEESNDYKIIIELIKKNNFTKSLFLNYTYEVMSEIVKDSEALKNKTLQYCTDKIFKGFFKRLKETKDFPPPEYYDITESFNKYKNDIIEWNVSDRGFLIHLFEFIKYLNDFEKVDYTGLLEAIKKEYYEKMYSDKAYLILKEKNAINEAEFSEGVSDLITDTGLSKLINKEKNR